MSIEIRLESAAHFAEYARVPTGFVVTEIFDQPALRDMLAGLDPPPTRVPTPYWKDYDSYAGNSPADWATRFDVSGWQIFAAYYDRRRVGGAVLILRDPQIDLLDRRSDLGLLWDVRVAPGARRLGVGHSLVAAAVSTAVRAGCAALRVETQNVNVAACRFYRACGFALEAVRHHAYSDLPDEVQLLWSRSIV